MRPAKALLLLEDGTVFEGVSLGETGEAIGEVVFYTGVVGYQEALTNPSYGGTLLVLTYPMIGSYGVNPEDNESDCAHVRGMVVKEYSAHYSNFRATGALEDFLRKHHIVGIQGVDTRAVAVHLREHGEMKGTIASGDFDRKALLEKLRQAPSPFDDDMLKDLACEQHHPVGAEGHRLVVLDLGIKKSLLQQLVTIGCSLEILPCAASSEAVLGKDAAGVIVAGGPGDPRVPHYVVETIKSLLGMLPILGIGLGHQILALALGCEIRRMKTGHRGVNHPVRETAHGRCEITIQHHSFVVDQKSISDAVEITHTNVNDGTIEGIKSRNFDASSVQFHPCPDEMGRPSKLLELFVERTRP